MAKKPSKKQLQVDALSHTEAKRRNIPTAELESVMQTEQKHPVRVEYDRRNRDLDPQLVWRGKDEQDWSDLVVQAPPLYIQEKVHPKVLIDDLVRQSKVRREEASAQGPDLFADFNGLHDPEAKTEFYAHDQNWTNRMILGDSLQVMASLAEREGLRGQVQCIYIDPPYGIKFNSNFQWSTTSRTVTDGKVSHITREPEQVKAFRDAWRDGIHSYLTYLRDRLLAARDLLTDSGSIFVQIGHDNVHLVRSVMDEVFGDGNCITEIVVKKKGSQISGTLDPVNDYILWYGRRDKEAAATKFRPLLIARTDDDILDDFPNIELASGERLSLAELEERDGVEYSSDWDKFVKAHPAARPYALNPLKSGGFRKNQSHDFRFWGRVFPIGDNQCWKHTVVEPDAEDTPGMTRLAWSGRLEPLKNDVRFVSYFTKPSAKRLSNWWDKLGGAPKPTYVVQTNPEIIKRCVLMTTDPGDLVFDPTCGSGTTAYVAEQWGRRWITADTSRVALALARARIMGARYPFYLLADSDDGRTKEAEVSGRISHSTLSTRSLREGFVHQRVRRVTSGSVANNAEIDVIWEKWRATLAPIQSELNAALSKNWEEWETPLDADSKWPTKAKSAHERWWRARIERQKEIDASIAAKAEFEYLYDKPYIDSARVRVAGPFTVESLSPHRVLAMGEGDELIDEIEAAEGKRRTDSAATPPPYPPPQAGEENIGAGGGASRMGSESPDFAQMILENLKTAGVQQAHKEDRITFTSLVGWPGEFICAEGKFLEGTKERRAGVFIGPEFGTVAKPDLVAAAREAGDAGFDVVVACAFNFDAHSSEFEKLGRIPVLKARMNPELHMAGELKNTGGGNLFVVFGEPDIRILKAEGGRIQVKIAGVDVFKPQTGEIESGGPDTIALWMVDTDYNEESFFVRHAYFLGANDPYKALKTTLKAEIDEEAWASLHSEVSRPFEKPKSGRIAVKVINHLGDEVMKVFPVK